VNVNGSCAEITIHADYYLFLASETLEGMFLVRLMANLYTKSVWMATSSALYEMSNDHELSFLKSLSKKQFWVLFSVIP
jgi:hypothetical protein